MQPQPSSESPRPVETGAGAPRVRPAVLGYGFRPFYLLAALARVFGPLAASGAGESWLLVSAALWSLSIAALPWTYAPILCRPRIAGRPG